jgi:hypothetical protein
MDNYTPNATASHVDLTLRAISRAVDELTTEMIWRPNEVRAWHLVRAIDRALLNARWQLRHDCTIGDWALTEDDSLPLLP